MESTTTIEITDNAFLRQYECTKDGQFAKIEYSQQERKIFLTKFILPESLEDDKDFQNEFLRAVFIDIRDVKEIKVVPTHPKIAGFVRKNRNEFKEMLPVGISI
ncbi:MAG: N-acetyltransferase [Nonlabens sp.]|uniref:N-acetyltransferase n=1 Tax=Nonlabens sp. TaxID=1888209 RepID=UPI003EF3A7A0